MQTPVLGALAAALAATLIGGCSAFGPRTIHGDRFDYSAAIARSRDEQMLLNIVRLRYLQVPEFLAVSSVIASYSYGAGVGVAGSGGTGATPDIVSGNANVSYSERPTITYAPLAGQDFSRRLMTSLPIDAIFSLGQAGWPTDILMSIAVQRLNDVENMGFGQVPAPGDLDRDRQFELERAKLVRFQRVLRLIVLLESRHGIEVVRRDEQSAPRLHIAASAPAGLEGAVAELRRELGLDPAVNEFVITERATGRAAGEITIKTRSLLAIMSFLARGIDVPEEDRAAGRVVVLPPDVREEVVSRIPLRIRSAAKRPANAFCAIQYRGKWFYVDDSDIASKRTFATMLVIFQLQAPTAGSGAPLLTLPTGG